MRDRIVLFTLSAVACAAVIFSTLNTLPHSLRREQDNEERGRSGALESMDFWTRSRAYPENDIPQRAYFQAYQYSKMKQKEISRTISSGSVWNPIGPINLQGRSLSVAINPQHHTTIYVGTASGGLWRSRTSGLCSDWEQVKLGYPVLGVASIVIDPTDSNTMYLGTGEVYKYHGAFGGVVDRTTRGSYGIGILKTTDGGETWSKSLDWTYNQQDGVQMLRMNPLNPHTIWAATTQGILKSVDAGATWPSVYGIAAVCTDVVVHSGDTNKVIAAVGNFGTPPTILLRTSNGGSTWDTLTGISSYSGKAHLALYASNPDIVYVSVGDSTTGVGGLWRSTDFGDTWAIVSDYTTNNIFGVQGWYSHYVAIHPTNASRIIHNSVGSSTSDNGGVTFSYPSGNYSDNHGYAIDPVDPDIFYTANDDGIYRSTNFGGSYTNVGYGMQSGQLYNGFSNSSQDSTIAIVQSQDHIPGYMFQNTPDWTRSALDESGWTAIDPTNDNNMFAVNRYGGSFARSTNRGATWTYLAGFGSVGSWNSPLVVAPSLVSTIYFGDTRIRKSTNTGSAWTVTNGGSVLDGNPTLSMAVSFTSPDTVYVGLAPIVTTAHLYRTTNGGTSWTNVTGTLPDRYPMDVAVDPNDSRVVYAAMGGFGSGHVFKSTNAGTGWSDISGTLPDAPATAVVVDPLNSNIVYVGNDLGVYASTNGGSSWSAFSDGLPDAVIVSDLTISPSNRTLRLGTYGNGAYERKMIGNYNPADFDYRPLAFLSPTDGGTGERDSAMHCLIASFRNGSAVTPLDSFDVKYRILSGTTELFSTMKRIPPLQAGESRTITFPDEFTPVDTGTLTIEAISMETDDHPQDDTLRGSLTILLPSRVNGWTISTSGCPYAEIVGGTAGPSGDDAQKNAPLPFAFKYDGYDYDSVQMSTNGWVELGTGTPGSARGLSTPGQMVGYFFQALASKARPTKVLGGWWTDLNTATTGSVTYKTEGSAPDRVFIIQFKDMLAYYDEGVTSLRINFQIQLFEGSNKIEYHYGPVVAGAFPGYATGAAIGLKDYVGGDYRYYDLASMSTGPESDLRTDLTPLADWPGENTCIVVQTNPEVGVLSHESGWNLVSLPVNAPDSAAGTIFPGLPVFKYTGGHYEPVAPSESLSAGQGYWTKFPSAGEHTIAGAGFSTINSVVVSGWNMIGSVDHTVTAPSGGIIISPVYGYSTVSGYSATTSLAPGKGYWIKTSAAGTLPLGPTMIAKRSSEDLHQMSSLQISDAGHHAQLLYFSGTHPKDSRTGMFELPPPPPSGTFAARFLTGTFAEFAGSSPKNIPIVITSASFPVTLSYVLASASIEASLVIDGVHHRLSDKGSIILQEEPQTLSLLFGAALIADVPLEFGLNQNYPNPFNPVTVIRYQLPEDAHVVLKIYDLVGREVSTLIDEGQSAGYRQVTFDANNLASGVYMYRIHADPVAGAHARAFSDTKKMIVIK